MNKKYYSSGFLYHPASEQILLQQENPTDPTSTWSLLGGTCTDKETIIENFKHVAHTLLKLNLRGSAIHSVYDYFHQAMGKNHFVSYAVVDKLVKFPSNQKTAFAWFDLREISKLKLTPQTKQDIIVSRRVIEANVRKNTGERYIE